MVPWPCQRRESGGREKPDAAARLMAKEVMNFMAFYGSGCSKGAMCVHSALQLRGGRRGMGRGPVSG